MLEKERAEQWRSPRLRVELGECELRVLAVGVPAAERVLTAEERAFVEQPAAPLAAPREIIELSFAAPAQAQAYIAALVARPPPR